MGRFLRCGHFFFFFLHILPFSVPLVHRWRCLLKKVFHSCQCSAWALAPAHLQMTFLCRSSLLLTHLILFLAFAQCYHYLSYAADLHCSSHFRINHYSSVGKKKKKILHSAINIPFIFQCIAHKITITYV